MKKIVLIATIFCLPLTMMAQLIANPVTWAFKVKKINAGLYEIHLTANIAKGWHTYSQSTPDGGPIATVIKFINNPLVKTEGAIKEIGKLEQHYEALFGVDVKQFSGRVDFVQKIKLSVPAKTSVTGTIQFMVCNDKECLPPKNIPFTVSVN